LIEGATEASMGAEPEIIVVEPEATTESAEANGNNDAAPATTEPANANGITDPVLLRLMQRRQQLNQ
jgi:hypothetical protein